MNRNWHDSAMRALPLWLGMTMLNTSVLLGLLFFFRVTRDEALVLPLPQLLTVFWLAMATYLLVGKVRTRCNRLEMTLPIPVRELWRHHLAGVTLASTTVLIASLGVLALHLYLMGSVRRSSLEVPIWPLVGPLFAGLLLAISLIDRVRPGSWSIPRGWRESSWTLGSLLGVLVLLLLLHRWPWVLIAVCLILSTIITRSTLNSLPATYRLVPREPDPVSASISRLDTTARSRDAARWTASTRPVNRWQVLRILYSVLHTAPPWKQFAPWLLYFFIALLGFVLGGGLDRLTVGETLRFIYIPFGSYMLLAGMGLISYHLFRLDPLPVSRRVLFAVLTLPSVVFFVVPYLAGWRTAATDPSPRPAIDYRVQSDLITFELGEGPDGGRKKLETRVWVEVDQRFMGMTLDGQVPSLTSPWGETHEAWYEPLHKGSRALLYNPFNTPEETTADFEALMVSRAIERIYGVVIPPNEIRDRYFIVEDDRVVALTYPSSSAEDPSVLGYFRGMPLLNDYPDLDAPPKGPEIPVYLALIMIPWLLLLALFVRSFRATSSLRRMRWVYWIGLALLLGPMIVQMTLAAFGLFSPDVARGILTITIHQLGSGSLLRLTTWAVAIAAILATYRLARSQFERAELPPGPLNFSLIDFGQSD